MQPCVNQCSNIPISQLYHPPKTYIYITLPLAPLTKNQPAVLLKTLHRYTLSFFTTSAEQFFADHLSMAPFAIPGINLHISRSSLAKCFSHIWSTSRSVVSLTLSRPQDFRKCSSEDFLMCFSRSAIVQTSFGPILMALVVQEIIFGSPVTQSS